MERPVESAAGASGGTGRLMRLLRNKRYSFGVVAQYFNVSAQTCIWTYTLHYVTSALKVSDDVAGDWLQASLIIFLVFRFLMVGLMGRFDARKLLLLMCSLGIALSLFAMVSVNILGVLAIISLSACISLLFPTIYGEALQGLGEDTKYGAAGLVMAIHRWSHHAPGAERHHGPHVSRDLLHHGRRVLRGGGRLRGLHAAHAQARQRRLTVASHFGALCAHSVRAGRAELRRSSGASGPAWKGDRRR